MTEAEKTLQKVEQAFGYPIEDRELRAFLLKDWTAELDDARIDEVFGYFIVRSVNWTTEGHPGEHPERLAAAAQAVRLEMEASDDPLDPELPEVLARHFCGLLSIEVAYVKRVPEQFLADLNPGGQHGAASIYRWTPSGHYDGPLFASVVELVGWNGLLRKLKRAEADEDQAESRRLGLEAREKYPRAFAVFIDRLVKDGLIPKELRVTKAGAATERSAGDAEGARLWSAYDALVPVARVLTARAQGERSATLSPEELSASMKVATMGGDWPPALLLGFLAPALGGSIDQARAAARAVVDGKRGVPLTLRWARAVLEEKAPFVR